MPDDLRYFRPRNWAKFQHYKDRRPPWIKLHRSLLRDHDFHKLTITQRYHLTMLWLLYADIARALPWDPGWIAGQLNDNPATIGKTLAALKDKEFIELCDKDASIVLAKRLQPASAETETESETETEKESRTRTRERPPSKKSSSRGTRCPDIELAEEWAQAANQKREKVGLPLLTLGQLKHRWEDFKTYWLGLAGAKALKKDWRMTWLNNCVSPHAEKKFRPTEVEQTDGPVMSSRFMT